MGPEAVAFAPGRLPSWNGTSAEGLHRSGWAVLARSQVAPHAWDQPKNPTSSATAAEQNRTSPITCRIGWKISACSRA